MPTRNSDLAELAQLMQLSQMAMPQGRQDQSWHMLAQMLQQQQNEENLAYRNKALEQDQRQFESKQHLMQQDRADSLLQAIVGHAMSTGQMNPNAALKIAGWNDPRIAAMLESQQKQQFASDLAIAQRAADQLYSGPAPKGMTMDQALDAAITAKGVRPTDEILRALKRPTPGGTMANTDLATALVENPDLDKAVLAQQQLEQAAQEERNRVFRRKRLLDQIPYESATPSGESFGMY